MLNLDNLPVIFGLIIVLAILIPSVLLLILYKKYLRLAKTLPNPDSIEQAQPAIIDEKRGLLASNLLDGWSTVPADEIEVTRHALWTAMLLEAASDGSIDHREMRFVADLFGQLGGDKIDFRPVIKAAELVENDKKTALKEISRASRVSNASKKHILAGAFLVSVSDHALTESETHCLGTIADALKINKRDRKAIFEGMTKQFGI